MDLFLQLWGSAFYLINKFFFALSGGRSLSSERTFKIIGWLAYIIGVPAWVIILLKEYNLMAAAIEFGGLPSMILGLYNTVKFNDKAPAAFDFAVKWFTYGLIAVGVFFSMRHYGGFYEVSQFLEVGMIVGFLLGVYFFSQDNRNGWLMFMLVNASTMILMSMQGRYILCAQQGLSFSLAVYGYISSFKRAAALPQ